jgi:nicotinate-nucleotide adenylyltransferase
LPDALDGTLDRVNTECAAVNIGLFGGRFDPIHLGHLCAAQDACEQQPLDRVIFVLAARTPRKAGDAQAPAQDRLALLRRAIKGDKRFTVSDFELRKGATSYTIDTVRHFRRRHPHDHLFWIIGSDHLRRIQHWKDIRELVRLVEFIVLDRPGHRPRVVPALPGLRLHRRVGHLPDVSSTQLRERVRRGRSLDYLMPRPVIDYIRRRKLYQHRPGRHRRRA